MNENEIFIFRYPASKKFISGFVLFALFCFLLMGFISEGPIWAGVITLLVAYLLFDFYFRKIFCKIEINKDKLVFKPGGIFWRFVFKKKAYYWDEYNFVTYCFHYQDKMYYSSFNIYNKKGKRCFFLKTNLLNDSELVDTVKKFNGKMRFLSYEAEVLSKGIIGGIKEIFLK